MRREAVGMWAKQVAVAGTLVTTLVLASCGNSGNGASPDETTSTDGEGPSAESPPETVRPCVIFTLQEVEALVGSPVTAGPNPHGGTSGCEWTAEVPSESGDVATHVVDLQVHDTGTPLDELLTLDGTPAAVPALGDEALVETSASGFPAVMAGYRDPDRSVTLLYQVQAVGAGTIDPRDDPAPVVAALTMLQGKIAAPAG